MRILFFFSISKKCTTLIGNLGATNGVCHIHAYAKEKNYLPDICRIIFCSIWHTFWKPVLYIPTKSPTTGQIIYWMLHYFFLCEVCTKTISKFLYLLLLFSVSTEKQQMILKNKNFISRSLLLRNGVQFFFVFSHKRSPGDEVESLILKILYFLILF